MIDRAILKINPNAQFSINGDDINQITWLNGTTPISKEDIEAQYPAVELDAALASVRIKRDRLLIETDHLALSDNTLSTDMATYRQKLRDITEGLNTVDKAKAVKFPTKP